MSLMPFIVIAVILLLGALDKMSWRRSEYVPYWNDEFYSNEW